MVVFTIFEEINDVREFPFLIFDFNQFFDGLIGMNILSQLPARIDIAQRTFTTPAFEIPLYIVPNRSSEIYEIEEESKALITVHVSIKEGPFLCDHIQMEQDFFITPGLYSAHNNLAKIEINNFSVSPKKFCLDSSLQVNKFEEDDFIVMKAMPDNPEYSQEHYSSGFHNIRTDHLNEEEKRQLSQLCDKFADLVFHEGDKLSFTNKVKHEIKITDNKPVFCRPFRFSPIESTEIQNQIDKLLNQNIIRHSHSPWSAPVFLVAKKLDASKTKKWRMVVDFRKLNEKTVKDRYPMPNINDVLDRIGRAKYFTAIDLASGYHQIEMEPRDISKTAFTAQGGHYEFVRMPFGLTNAPATFQRVMDNVLADLNGDCCLVYLDDIIVFSPSLQEHICDLESVFSRLKQANLKIQPDKSEFLRKEIEYLGHIVTEDGIKPNTKKIEAIKVFPIPTTRKEIKSFLGLLGYYRKFIKDFTKITKPMTKQLKGKAPVLPTEEFKEAFNTCKTLLCNDPILKYPDFTKPFVLTTDASNVAIGAVLSQGTLGSDRPVCFASRTLNDREVMYSTVEKEMLAIIWATKYFRPYLFGQKFQIVTDHKPLTWLMNFKEPNSKLVRWKLQLLEYDYEVVYKKGSQNVVADALSRVEIQTNCISNSLPNSLTNSKSIIISDRPLNEFKAQYIFEIGNEEKTRNCILFKNKFRRTTSKVSFDLDGITDILREILALSRIHAIFATDSIFKLIQEAYLKYFQNYKIIRCKYLLTDVTTTLEQQSVVTDYHLKNNHRGIEETLNHLKRTLYFPYMKQKITQIINQCDICQKLKYDRRPPKPIYQKTEIPEVPLQIVHMDIYTINGQTILTLIDKFSKHASAYTLVEKTRSEIKYTFI